MKQDLVTSKDRPAQAIAGRARRRRGGAARLVFWLACAGALAYSARLGYLWAFQADYWFRPAGAQHGDWRPRDLPLEDVGFNSRDGTRLHGWFMPHEKPRAIVLYCHGSGGNLTDATATLRFLHGEVQATALVFDYRGYGRSEGRFESEEDFLDDARAARRWLARRAGVRESEIVLVGRSLGSFVASDLAARDGARALVLEGAFTSLVDVASYHYRAMPWRWIMRYRLDTLARLPNYRGPLLQCHSNCDDVVPIAQARRLFDAARGPKHLVVLDGLAHADPHPRAYDARLGDFLRRHASMLSTTSP